MPGQVRSGQVRSGQGRVGSGQVRSHDRITCYNIALHILYIRASCTLRTYVRTYIRNRMLLLSYGRSHYITYLLKLFTAPFTIHRSTTLYCQTRFMYSTIVHGGFTVLPQTGLAKARVGLTSPAWASVVSNRT